MSQNTAKTPVEPAIWRCAVPSPLRRTFDYLPSKGCHGAATPGARVTVPFGKRSVTAIILSITAESSVEPAKLKAATALLDEQPLYIDTQRALLSWAADYYQHPLGEVLPLGLSPRERRPPRIGLAGKDHAKERTAFGGESRRTGESTLARTLSVPAPNLLA